jgi:uncharacterized protein
MSSEIILLTDALHTETEEDCRSAQPVLFATAPIAELENDCKSGGTFFVGRPRTANASFTQVNDAYVSPLPHGFWLALSPYAPAGPAVLNPAAWERWQSFRQPQPLTEMIDHALAGQMLVHPVGDLPRPVAAAPEVLTVWNHVSNACDLFCPYCYVRKSSARMSEETGRRALEAIFATAQRHGFREVKLKYAGGEATLHFKLIRQLHQQAVALAAATGLGLQEVVLTNGVSLRPDDAQWLADQGLKLMVSLDGVGELHDRLRPRRDGRPTFDKVEHTVDHLLLPRGIRPTIAMTVTGVNAHGAADVTTWALINRRLPLSLNFYRPNLLSTPYRELLLDEQKIIAGMLAAYAVIEEQLPLEPFLDGVLDRVQVQAHTHTCGVGHSYLVVSHTGQLAQCQMHLDSPVSDQLDEDLLLKVAQGPIHNLSVDEKEGCKSCTYRYKCSGGCSLETYRATGRWDIRSPHCNLYRSLLPAALRIEGKRLMKLHGYI